MRLFPVSFSIQVRSDAMSAFPQNTTRIAIARCSFVECHDFCSEVIVLDFGPPSMLVSTLFAIIGKLKAKGFGYFLPELRCFIVRQCTHSLQILRFGV